MSNLQNSGAHKEKQNKKCFTIFKTFLNITFFLLTHVLFSQEKDYLIIWIEVVFLDSFVGCYFSVHQVGHNKVVTAQKLVRYLKLNCYAYNIHVHVLCVKKRVPIGVRSTKCVSSDVTHVS